VNQRLLGKRAIITGGGSGIGRGAAIKLAEEGAQVAVIDVNLDAAQKVADEIARAAGKSAHAGTKVLALRANVADEAQVAEAVREAEERLGGLDTLIANAGIMLFGRDTIATELDLETWQQCIDVNLTGMFLTCKHGLRALERNGSGAVVITASPTGTHACAPTFTAYSASKAGTYGLMRILAIDYVKKNIRVNAVLPGTTNSPLVMTLMENPATKAEFLSKMPMARAADPREIANVIAFLASDEASYVTGAAWYADGGLTAI
jgi:NAD(P)-dependent dehydrogenase (short-subunit alcohol dehydrogenase family)